MVNFSFTGGPTYYGYAPGVNAANLTLQNIQDANARLDPVRQRRIKDGKIKATQADPGYKSPDTLAAETKPKSIYTKWSLKELVKAIVARKIKSKAELKRVKKRDLVAILEKADKHPEFTCFMELSPELRDMVYKFAIQDDNPKNIARVCPKTPAICRLNHQIRDETLPIFFRATRQNIIVSAKPGRSRPLPQGRSARTQTAETDRKSQEYFIHAEKEGWLQHMRHFQWRLMGRTLSRNGNVNGNFERHWYDRYFVDFSNNMQTVVTRMKQEDMEKDTENRLEGVQAKMAAITGGESRKMTLSVFYSMMTVFEVSVVERST